MLPAISLRGKTSTNLRGGAVDSEVFIGFREELLADVDAKTVHPILDNAAGRASDRTEKLAVDTSGKPTPVLSADLFARVQHR